MTATATIVPVTGKLMLDTILSGKPRVFLLDDTYVYSATHDFFDDIKAKAQGNNGSSTRGNGAEILNPITTGGVFSGDATTTIQNVPAGTFSHVAVINDDASADGTSRILMISNDASLGLPITTDGRDVVITWDTGAKKICTTQS